MTRDNLLFSTIGVLAGFISGYFVHEVMAVRQPPPLAVLEAAQAQLAGGSTGPAAPAVPEPAAAANDASGIAPAAGGPPGGGPAMEEILRLKAHVEQNPNDADAILALANLNYDIRSWARARELYERYLKLRPASADILTDLGVALRGLKEYDEAMKRFAEAQQLQDGHWQSLYNEVVVLAFDLKDMARAQQVLARLKQLQPDNPEVARLASEVAKQGGAA